MPVRTTESRRAARLEFPIAMLCSIVLCPSLRGQTAGAECRAPSDALRLTVERAERSVQLMLEGSPSGRYAITACDPRTAAVSPARVVRVGWHDAARATVVEFGPLCAGPGALALRAVLTPPSGRRTNALVASPTVIVPSSGSDAGATQSASAAAPATIPMRIRSCVLDCSSGGFAGAQISCGVINTFQNQDLSFRFTLPVDAASVSPNSAQILDVATGSVPPGSLFVDPVDTRRLTFRPALTFDALGNPQFGFNAGGTYQVRIPGFMQGDLPPFVLSTTGLLNEHRLLCSITANQGLMDYVPGAPRVAITVDVVTSYDPLTGLPNGFAQVPAAGASNVWTDSKITFDFDDVMNLSTLLIPASGALPFIRVLVDADGDLTTVADQTPQAGTAAFSLDLDARTCRLVFDPSPALPHSGTTARIVVDVPSVVKDIAGNSVSNAGVSSFQTEP